MFHYSHPNAFFQPYLHPRGCSREYLLGLGCQGCSGAFSTPFSRLLQPSVRSVVDLEVMTFGRHPLPYPSLCGRVTLSVGVHSVCAPVSKSGGLAGLLRSPGSVPKSSWFLLRYSGAVCTGAPSILARSVSGTMVHLSWVVSLQWPFHF